MQIKSFTVTAILLLVALASPARGDYDVNTLCNIMPHGIKLASLDSCQTYYTCVDGVGVAGSCAATEAFDPESQSCRAAAEADCTDTVKELCLAKGTGHVPNPQDCTGYYYCRNSVNQGGSRCPDKQIFVDGACEWGFCTNAESAGLTDPCLVVPKQVFFGTTEDCQQWQMCQEDGSLITGSCPGYSVFDLATVTCTDEKDTMCSRVSKPPSVVTMCNEANEDWVKYDPDVCSVHYTCEEVDPDTSEGVVTKQSCPAGEYYDVAKDKCLHRDIAITVDSCDRCEGTTHEWVNALDSSCRLYQTCRDGVRIGSGSCADNYFYDELWQACMQLRTLDDGSTNLDTYKTKNPVCDQ